MRRAGMDDLSMSRRAGIEKNSIRLRQRLSDVGLSQAELARRMDVTERTVSLWTTGKGRVPGAVLAYLDLLAEIMCVCGSSVSRK